jgi:hypothetical protein
MDGLTDLELQQVIEHQIERCCSILSDAAAVVDDLTTILASLCLNVKNAQIAELLDRAGSSSIKPL